MVLHFIFFFFLISLLGISGDGNAAPVPPGQSIGSTFRRAKLEKKTEAMEQTLAKKRAKPQIEGEAAVKDEAETEREQLEKDEIRSRVIS